MTGYCDGCGLTGECTCQDDAANEYVEGLQKQLATVTAERDKLKKEREQMEKQEPAIAWSCETKRFKPCTRDNAVAAGWNHEGHKVQKLYAKPFPSTEQLQQRVKELADALQELLTEAKYQSSKGGWEERYELEKASKALANTQ